MSKALVAYFSATGVTAKVAKDLAKAVGADLFEIEPKDKYSQADLNWQDRNSRSSVEMSNKSKRPEIVAKDAKIANYDVVFIGFPIWWYVAPTIVNTFLESCDFSGKKIILFATSGSSGLGRTADELKPSAKGAEIVDGKLWNGGPSVAELKAWGEKYL